MNSTTKICAALIFCSSTALVGWISVQHVASGSTGANCNAIAFTLHPGVVKVPGVRGHWPTPPANMPLTPVAAVAPLYPNAKPTTATPAAVEPGLPANRYLETASARYAASTGLSKVISWYESAFAGCGYTLFTNGSGRNGAHSPTGYDYEYQGITVPNLQVALTFQGTKSGGTLIWYYVHAISQPSRPKSANIPFMAKSVKITYVFSGDRKEWHITVPSTAAAELRYAVGFSQTLVFGPLTCAPRGPYAMLTFISKSSQTKRVTVDPGCFDFQIGKWAIDDKDSAVWWAVQLTAYRYCMGHTCTKMQVKLGGA